jgi:hypothetical protein
MDARQPAPPPFQRPPDRHMLHNPNHQPSPQSYAAYTPPTSQPQQPLHVPFSSDPYAVSRRDPFLPTASQHVRRTSQGGDMATQAQAQAERQGGWTHAGTEHTLVFCFGYNLRYTVGLWRVLDELCGMTEWSAHVAMSWTFSSARAASFARLYSSWGRQTASTGKLSVSEKVLLPEHVLNNGAHPAWPCDSSQMAWGRDRL